MSVTQISISLENVPGKFLDVSEILRAEGINIRAISVADTADISTVRFVPIIRRRLLQCSGAMAMP